MTTLCNYQNNATDTIIDRFVPISYILKCVGVLWESNAWSWLKGQFNIKNRAEVMCNHIRNINNVFLASKEWHFLYISNVASGNVLTIVRSAYGWYYSNSMSSKNTCSKKKYYLTTCSLVNYRKNNWQCPIRYI